MAWLRPGPPRPGRPRRAADRGRVPGRVARPASRSARRSRSAASASRRRPDRLEAVPLLGRRPRSSSASASAIAWVARWSSAGSDEATAIGSARTHAERAVRLARRDRDGRIRDAGLGGQRGRPGRQRRPGAEQPHRDAVAAVAPVDQQAEHLAPAEHAEDRAQVAPRDERRRPTARAARGGSSNSSGNAESSATTLIGSPCRAIAAADAPRCCRRGPRSTIRPPPGDAIADALDLDRVERLDERGDLVRRQERQAHQLDEVAAVLAVGAQRQPADPRVVGRQAQDVPEVLVRPVAASSARAGTTACGAEAEDGAGRAGRAACASSHDAAR